MGIKKSVIETARFWGEVWDFMKVRKKWWLLPIIVLCVLLGMLIILTEGSALAPFIYTIF